MSSKWWTVDRRYHVEVIRLDARQQILVRDVHGFVVGRYASTAELERADLFILTDLVEA